MNYLDTSCRNSTNLKSALQKDIRNSNLLLQLHALGIIGKLVTGPWMQQLYGNQMVTNLESVPYIETCVRNLKGLMDFPLHVFQTSTDMFGMPLNKESDEILRSLHIFSAKDKASMTEILSRLIASIIEVIEKQMSEYLDGSLSNVSLATVHQTYSAPAHNMFAEQTLGLADHHFITAPNITIGFIDGKVKTKINKTLKWLESNTQDQQDRVMQFCINQSQKMKVLTQMHEKKYCKRTGQATCRKKSEKDGTFRRKLQKKMQDVADGKAQLHDEFPELQDNQRSTITAILTNPAVIIGLHFEHMWSKMSFTKVMSYH